MDTIFSEQPLIELEINRPTIKNLWIYQNKVALSLLELDEVLEDEERYTYLKSRIEFPFSKEADEWQMPYEHCIRLEVQYIDECKELIEETLYFEFNNYILEFGFKRRNMKIIIYYLKHIHELDNSVKNKRKLLGAEDIILTAEQIDELLKQGKIHQVI